jgi:hypothetical protein
MFRTLRAPMLTGLLLFGLVGIPATWNGRVAGLDISEHGMHADPSDGVSGGAIA